MAPLVPSPKTLDKYGLTAAEWIALYERQGGVCAVCRVLPSSGRLNVDHQHVRGWKQMPADQRKQYVRGLVCYVDNHRLLTRGATIERLQNAADYLRAYAARTTQPANDNRLPKS